MAEVLGGLVSKARDAIRDEFDLLLAILGAGAPAAVVEAVRSWFPEQTEGIGDETLAAIIGFVIWYFGGRIHPRLVPFGFGMFLASVGAWSEGLVSQLLGMLKKG